MIITPQISWYFQHFSTFPNPFFFMLGTHSKKQKISDMSSDDIDSDMSCQIYALGKETQLRIMSSSVLVLGVDALGVEVAKNLLLMDVRTLGICDKTSM